MFFPSLFFLPTWPTISRKNTSELLRAKTTSSCEQTRWQSSQIRSASRSSFLKFPTARGRWCSRFESGAFPSHIPAGDVYTHGISGLDRLLTTPPDRRLGFLPAASSVSIRRAGCDENQP